MFMDTISRPVATGNQALVKIKAFGLNRMDLLQRDGKYPVPPQAPSTMGVEFSGVIEELPDSQSGFKVGDEVFGLAYGGKTTSTSISNPILGIALNGQSMPRCLCGVCIRIYTNAYPQAIWNLVGGGCGYTRGKAEYLFSPRVLTN